MSSINKSIILERIFVYQAVEYGYLTEEQFYECKMEQERKMEQSPNLAPIPLLTISKQKKYLSPSQVNQLMSKRLDASAAKAFGEELSQQHQEDIGISTVTPKVVSKPPISLTEEITERVSTIAIPTITSLPQKEREEFEKLLAQKDRQLQIEQKRSEFLTRRNEELERSTKNFDAEKQSLLSKKQKELSELQSDLVCYRGLHDQKEQQLKKLQELLDEREIFIKREHQKSRGLNRVLDQSAQELRESEELRVKLEAECEKLRKEIEFLNTKIDKESKEKLQVKQDNEASENKIKELQQKFDAIQSEYEQLKNQLSAAAHTVTGKGMDASTLELQKIELERKSREQTKLLERLQQRDVEYEDLRSQIDRLKKELELSRKEISEKKHSSESIQEQLNKKEEEFHRIRISLESDVSQYKQKSEVLEGKLKQYQDSLKSWDDITQQNLQYKKQLEEEQKNRKESDSQKNNLEIKVQELSSKLKQFQNVTMNAEGELDPGTLLPGSDGKYYIIQKMLGRGGMGIAYTALSGCGDQMEEKPVVIKTLLPENMNDMKVVMRFVQEARTIISFDHPNLVHGYDIQQGKTLTYFVMEYIDGDPVENVLEEQALIEPVRATEIVLGVARALEYLESKHLVHRDVKPANIMLTAGGIPKLVDFGIVKMTDRCYSLTTEGIILGTPYYLSPEQTYQTNVDIRSDIYSLGATYYHMVIGEVPFPGDNPIDVIQKRLVKSPKPSKVKPDLPTPVNDIIEKMMSKNINKRHEHVSEVVADLQKVLERIKK